MTDSSALVRLARTVDGLEDRASGYITLQEVRAEVGDDPAVEAALAEDLLLVDYRERLDTTTWQIEPVTFCRLNRHHPVAKALYAGEG